MTFGRFRVVHMGDLTWNKEFDLMCPTNHIGTTDLFVVSHHGQAVSNAPVLVHALRPRVAIMNNGTRKGGQPDAMKTLYSSPGLEDIWQLQLLAAERPGVHRARSLHREHNGRTDVRDADCGHARATAWTVGASAARAQWSGVLAQSIGPARRLVQRHERPQRLYEGLSGRC